MCSYINACGLYSHKRSISVTKLDIFPYSRMRLERSHLERSTRAEIFQIQAKRSKFVRLTQASPVPSGRKENWIFLRLQKNVIKMYQKLTLPSITWFEIIVFKSWTKETIGKKTTPKWDTTDDLNDNAAKAKSETKTSTLKLTLDMSFVYVAFLIYIS